MTTSTHPFSFSLSLSCIMVEAPLKREGSVVHLLPCREVNFSTLAVDVHLKVLFSEGRHDMGEEVAYRLAQILHRLDIHLLVNAPLHEGHGVVEGSGGLHDLRRGGNDLDGALGILEENGAVSFTGARAVEIGGMGELRDTPDLFDGF